MFVLKLSGIQNILYVLEVKRMAIILSWLTVGRTGFRFKRSNFKAKILLRF